MPKFPEPPFLLAGLAFAGLAAGLTWAAFSPEAPRGPEQQVLGIVSTSRIQSLHPHERSPTGTALMRTRLIQALREGLVEFDPRTQSPRAAAAESWTIAADHRSAVFHLRSGLRWNNGEPLTAEDFVFALRLAVASPSAVSESLAILKNARAVSEGRIADRREIGVTAVDARTLRIELERPVPGLLLELCDVAWLPLHAASTDALRDRSYWRRPELLVTNGPFELAEATADVVALRPNPYYRARDEVRLTRVEIHYTEDAALYPRLMQSGRIQMSDRLASGEIDLPVPAGIQLWRDPTLSAGYVHFNLRSGPLTDLRIRRALSLALDRSTLARDVSSANVRPAYTCLPPIGDWEEMHTVEEDLPEARRLLALAGYPEGRGLPVLRWPFRLSAVDASVRLPEVCSSQWRDRLGLQVYVLPVDDEEFQRRVAAREYDIVLAPLQGTVPDLARLASQLASDRMRSYSGWDGGSVTRLVETAREESGDTLHSQVLAVERAFLADMPAAPLIFYNRHLLKNLSVAGWYPDATGLHPLKYLYLTGETPTANAD
jgi:ABC-type oligopeptide transport system substrate-binding subunit